MRRQNEEISLSVLDGLCWNNLEAFTGVIFDLSGVNKRYRANLIFLRFDLTLGKVYE